MRRRRRAGVIAGKDLRPGYRFDYTLAKPNRFARYFTAGSVAVVLEPDVASVFQTSESVNTLLRSVLAAIPKRSRGRATGGAKRRSSKALQRTRPVQATKPRR